MSGKLFTHARTLCQVCDLPLWKFEQSMYPSKQEIRHYNTDQAIAITLRSRLTWPSKISEAHWKEQPPEAWTDPVFSTGQWTNHTNPFNKCYWSTRDPSKANRGIKATGLFRCGTAMATPALIDRVWRGEVWARSQTRQYTRTSEWQKTGLWRLRCLSQYALFGQSSSFLPWASLLCRTSAFGGTECVCVCMCVQ